MSNILYRKDLTAEQLAAVDKAAFVIIKARKEAAEMLVRAGLEIPPEDHWFGNPCTGMADELHPCPCKNYTGDGGPCLTRTTTDSGFPPSTVCGHRAIEHLPT